jgi:hypothetical protein
MTKADYVHLFKEACGGRCNAEYNPCAFRQAADSLAALKPVALWNGSTYDSYNSFIYNKDKKLFKDEDYPTHLYALDEANNESA